MMRKTKKIGLSVISIDNQGTTIFTYPGELTDEKIERFNTE